MSDNLARVRAQEAAEFWAWGHLGAGTGGQCYNRRIVLDAFIAGSSSGVVWPGGQIDDAAALILAGATLFREYEFHHRAKIRPVTISGREIEGNAEASTKAERNAAMAERFEQWLDGVPSLEAQIGAIEALTEADCQTAQMRDRERYRSQANSIRQSFDEALDDAAAAAGREPPPNLREATDPLLADPDLIGALVGGEYVTVKRVHAHYRAPPEGQDFIEEDDLIRAAHDFVAGEEETRGLDHDWQGEVADVANALRELEHAGLADQLDAIIDHTVGLGLDSAIPRPPADNLASALVAAACRFQEAGVAPEDLPEILRLFTEAAALIAAMPVADPVEPGLSLTTPDSRFDRSAPIRVNGFLFLPTRETDCG